MTYHKECTCRIKWSSATGTHDTVTGEWLPEATTTHVELMPAPDCPMHPTIQCWGCAALEVSLRFFDIPRGWARRADGLVASCPDHLEDMPPARV